MGCDLVHRFNSCGDFDTPLLQSVRSYSELARHVSGKVDQDFPVGKNPAMA